VQYCYLRFGLEKDRFTCWTPSRTSASRTPPGPASRSGSTTSSSPTSRRRWSGGAEGVIEVEKQYLDGAITNGERYNKVISIWSS